MVVNKLFEKVVYRKKGIEPFLRITVWITLFLIVTGPRSFPFLPGPVRLFDLAFVVTVFLFLALLTKKTDFRLPVTPHTYLFLFYVGLVMIIPFLGVIYYQQYVALLFGDLRWLQVLFLFFLLFFLYKETNPLPSLEKFIWVILLFQLPFVFFQVLLLLFGVSPPFYLELWYPNGGSGYGYYGQHIGRFAGAMNTASGLALISGVGLALGGLLLFVNTQLKYIFLFILSGLLMVAAGTRAMLLGVPVAVLILVVLKLFQTLKFKKVLLKLSLLFLPILSVTGFVIYYFNIGRVATSDRYIQVLQFLYGNVTFFDVSGRAGDRWYLPIQEAFTNWSPFGTLINSSHALSHLPAFDSYFVIAIAQAGPFLIVPFLLVLFSLYWTSLQIYFKGNVIGIFIISLTLPISISIITQNTMTGMTGRVLLMLAVFLNAVCYNTKIKI